MLRNISNFEIIEQLEKIDFEFLITLDHIRLNALIGSLYSSIVSVMLLINFCTPINTVGGYL